MTPLKMTMWETGPVLELSVAFAQRLSPMVINLC